MPKALDAFMNSHTSCNNYLDIHVIIRVFRIYNSSIQREKSPIGETMKACLKVLNYTLIRTTKMILLIKKKEEPVYILINNHLDK